MPSSTKSRIAIAFVLVYLIWGSTYLAIHVAGLRLAPPLVGALRTLVSASILACFCLARGISLRMPRQVAWQLSLVGILFMSANNVLLIWGETKVPSGYASLVIAMIPILVALMETALPGGETLNFRGWIGTVLGGVGMFWLVWPALHGSPEIAPTTSGTRTLAGFAILVLAALAFAVGSVLSRRFRFKVDPLAATAWQLGAASLVNFAIAIPGGNLRTAVWTTGGVVSVLYLAIFGSVVGLTAYVYLLKHVPVTKVSTYAFVNPVIAVLIGVVTLHERLSPPEILGMVIILIAVATVILSRTKAPSVPSDPLLEVPIEE